MSGPAVDDGLLCGGGPGARQHLVGDVDALDVDRAMLACPAQNHAEPGSPGPAPAARAQRLPRSVEGAWTGTGACRPLRAMLPDVRGRRCWTWAAGSAGFCRWAREHGAVHVEGIDVSDKMLARARATTAEEAIV